MSKNSANRRKAENEVIFRRHNERIQNDFDEIKQIAVEDDQEHLVPEIDGVVLHFYCECSDENCRMRIPLKSSEYVRIHKDRHHFIAVPGHETQSIEKVIDEQDDYFIVEKLLVPRVTNINFNALNATDINNV
jgi:hypothetical protein